MATGGMAVDPTAGGRMASGRFAAAEDTRHPGDARTGAPASRDASLPPPGGAEAEWAREWKKIDMLAKAWLDGGRDRGLLLRGAKLSHARRWLAGSRGKAPEPRPEHRRFILASVRAAQLRLARNVVLGGVALGVIGAVVVSIRKDVQDDGPEPRDPTEVGHRGRSTPTDPPPPGPDPEALRVQADLAAEHAAALLESDPTLATLVAMNALDHISTRERGSRPEQVLRDGLSRLEGVPLLGHERAVTQVAFSPDGRWAISGSDDLTARVWDLESRGLIKPFVLRGHVGPLRGLAVTPDSRFLFTAASDGSIFRWNLAHEQPNATSELVPGHDYEVTALELSGDGRWLASGSVDGAVRLWDATQPTQSPKLVRAHEAAVRALDFSRDGTVLASAGDDSVAHLFRIEASGFGRRVRLEGHEAGVRAVAISPDGRWIVTGSDDGTGRLWEQTRRGGAPPHRVLAGHQGPVEHVAVTPDGTLALTAAKDDKIMVWNLEAADPEINAVTFNLHSGDITGLAVAGPRERGGAGTRVAASASADQTARTWNLDRREHEQASEEFKGLGAVMTSVAFSSDGAWLLTGAQNGALRLWDPKDHGSGGASRVARGHASAVLDVAVNAVGTRMATAGADGTARIWDIASAGWLKELAVLEGHQGRVRSVAIDKNGRFLATAGDDAVIRLWALDGANPAAGHLPLRGHKNVVNELTFTPDGNKLISISADRTARIWPMTQTAEKDVVVLPHRDELNSMAMSDDGRWLVTGSISQVHRWDLHADDVVASGRALDGKGRSKLHEIDILAVGIAPDGQWAASSSQDPTLVLWDLRQKGAAIRLRRHAEPVDTIAFSPDGRWLATGSRDTTIRLWDLATEHPDENSLELAGHQGRVASLRFTADGKRLISGGYDKIVRVWDLASGNPEVIARSALVLAGHDQLISAIDLSGDERMIASVSYDGSARIWPLEAEELIAIGCRRVGRNLTPDEWSKYFTDPYEPLCPS